MDTIDYIFLGYYGFVVFMVIIFLWNAGDYKLYDVIWGAEVSPDGEGGLDVIIGGDPISLPPNPENDPTNPPVVGDNPATWGPSEGDGFKGDDGEYTVGVYFRKHRDKNVDEQDAFVAMNLQPADVVGGEHGLPLEGMRSGGYIPLPYSQANGMDTNEKSTMNL